jgi:diguanylate cyclase (GGDEF)-like protein
MAEGGVRRWFGPPTWCLAAGVILTALYYLLPGGGWAKGAIVASLSACLLVAVSAGARFDRRRLEEKIRHQALYDPLTELPNRTLFLDRVGHAVAGSKRRERPVAVLMIDLDGFNTVNDSLGEDAGDQVLVEVGDRLRTCLRSTDTVARMGGDEFAMLLVDAGIPEATRVADRVFERLGVPFLVKGKELFVDASIGIAQFPDGSGDGETVVGAADAAMYSARRAGKQTYEIYQRERHVASLEQFELLTELRRALERREFVLHYQPIVRLDDGQIVGVEALTRWNHPKRGMVPPAGFIPLAEQAGLIVAIDRWVTAEACRQGRVWQQRFPSDRPLGISVNLSARQLQDPDLLRDVGAAVEAFGLAPASLTLEITETVLMQDTEATLSVLRALKALGVRLAIDDFGIGFSSLSYLRRLPVDVVKIDRSFVAGVATGTEEWTLARGIIRLVHSLGLETVAEGVERPEQRAHLMALGCRLAQGYLFARPAPADAITELLGRPDWRSA